MDIPGRLRKESGVPVGSPDIPSVVEAAGRGDPQLECHPLNTPWTLWLDKTERGLTAAQYEAAMREIYTVRTAETFWAVFSNVPDVCDLNRRYSYHLMRHQCRPLWEEPRNVRGGTWRMKCPREDASMVWKELLLACIGEQFEDSIAKKDEIRGASISIRERDMMIQIWNANGDLADKARVVEKLQSLVPKVRFSGNFYKRHDTHHAFERAK